YEAIIAALNHPAVPPPITAIVFIALFIMDYSLSIFDNVLYNKCPLGHFDLMCIHFSQLG
ncbi:MAG: hypothetical protein V7683_15085, partial [Pseudoalteromonas distincta]